MTPLFVLYLNQIDWDIRRGGKLVKTIALFVLLNCFSSNMLAAEETPKEGVKAIIVLYQSGDFKTLMLERYSEIYKAEAAGKVDYLIQNYTRKLANEKLRADVISYYQLALAGEATIMVNPNPRITETDQMVAFDIEGGPLLLYLQKSHKWGFHM